MPLHVLIAGGGTAGHVYPGLALAGALKERGHAPSFLGTSRGLESALVPGAGFELRTVPARPLSRRPSLSALRTPFDQVAAARAAAGIVRGMDVVVGMGGYVSVPAVVAARRQHIPVVLHEQNAVPGLANRTLSRIASAVAIAFPDAARAFPPRARVVLTGNPVRDEILRVPGEQGALAKDALVEFDLDPGRLTIAIFGGSQGALHIDRAAAGACRLLQPRSDLQVLLVTGPAHLPETLRTMPREPDGGLRVRAVGYVERMDLLYAVADLVVSRAGATTVAELTVCGIPALLIPYPYATNGHQEANARGLERAGGATVVLDEDLSAIVLAERIGTLIDQPGRRSAMATRSRAFGRADAAGRLADLVEEAGG